MIVFFLLNYFYRKRIQDELDRNTELELNLIKLKNNIKELENKIDLFKTKELCHANDDLKIEVFIHLS